MLEGRCYNRVGIDAATSRVRRLNATHNPKLSVSLRVLGFRVLSA